MAVLHVFLVTLAICGLDAVKGEIPNEIQQYVLGLLQEHDGEVMELKQEIRTLRREVSSLQMSYLSVLHELDDLKQKKVEKELVSMETATDDKIQKLDIKNPSSQNVTQSNAPHNAPGGKQLPHNAERIRKGRLVPHNMTANYPTAFSTSMSRDLSNIQNNQVLPFDIATLNIGNAFDITSGVFTPTTKGVYVLFSTITTNPGKRLEAAIVRNGHWLCNLYAGDMTFFSPGSNMAVAALDIGDRVLVRIHDKYHDDGVTIDGAFSSFSGFLLYETD
uniref:C1q domain-containing protein n=1 Tax=Magallana gigas TaxID=29159 RepID=A0A8W8KIS7_MAGGI|nr:complement C1q tumor necrosis factor-related protein 8 [Crassostrea gigas]